MAIPKGKTRLNLLVDKEDWFLVKDFLKKANIKQSYLIDQFIKNVATVLREPDVMEIIKKDKLTPSDVFYIISRFMRVYERESRQEVVER